MTVTFQTVWAGTKALATWWLKHGGEKVPQAVADSRAAVCADCPQNIDRVDCAGCTLAGIRDLLVRTVGDVKTASDEKLRVCKVCLCENKAKVWLPIDAIMRSISPEQMTNLPASCWIKKENQPTI
jgi:hypothetical protein